MRIATAWTALALLAASAQAQTAPPPAFEVASVKPVAPLDPAKLMSGEQKIGATIDAARADFRAVTLSTLIRTAYQVKGYQLSGPEWIDTERYDVVAKLPEGGKRGQIPEMLQALLAERFQLVLHRTTKDLPGFALVVAKNPPNLKPSAPPPEDAASGAALRSGTGLSDKGVVTHTGPNGTVNQTVGPSGMHLDIVGMSMPGLAEELEALTHRPVADRTGIQGKFDFVLDLSREELSALAGAPSPGRDSAVDRTAELNEQSLAGSLRALGLKLETRQVPIEVLVVDKVEKTPSGN